MSNKKINSLAARRKEKGGKEGASEGGRERERGTRFFSFQVNTFSGSILVQQPRSFLPPPSFSLSPHTPPLHPFRGCRFKLEDIEVLLNS